MSAPDSPPRRRRWIYVPFALLMLLAALWTGAWFYAANRAETVMTAWIEQEASQGRSYDCASRQVGGYPFRIEVRCADPTATLRGRNGEEPVVLKARSLLAVAQIYQPDLIVAEATGPMTVSTASGQALYSAEWTLLQASLRGRPRTPERVSLVVDGPVLTGPGGAAAQVARADRLEAHLRRSAGADPASPAFDLALRTTGASVAAIAALGDRPINAEATGVLRGLKDLRPKPLPARLREWQTDGGRLELTQARLTQGDALAVATGVVGLSPQGRLDGTVHITMAGLDQLAGLIFGDGQSGRAGAGLLTGLTMLGRTNLEGRRAVAVPLSFRDGRIFFGPVPVGHTPAFY